ncbi:MAG TPA: hypothetical protein PLN52_26325, partial [Opitutaceae bacterium]|nr:hypothetical protein [Opitutaceae bacterium]
MPSRRPLLRVVGILFLLSSTIVSVTAALPEHVVADLKARAERGDSIAQYNLGIAYADPTEPIADYAEAYTWLSLAAERGANQKALTTLVTQLSPDQVAEAKRRLESRRATLARVATSTVITPVVDTPPAAASTATAPSADLSNLQKEKKQLSDELAAAWRETEAVRKASIGKVAELNQQIAALTEEIAHLKATPAPAVASPVQGVTAAEQERLKSSLEQSEAARQRLTRDLETLSNETNRLKTQLAAEQRAHSDVAAQALASKGAVADVTTLRSELATLRTELEAARAETTRLDRQLRSVEGENQNLVKQRAETAAQTAQSATLGAELERVRQELAVHQQSSGQFKAEADRLTAELETLKAAPKVSDKSLQLEADLSTLQQTLAVTEKERDALREQLAQTPPPEVAAQAAAQMETVTRQLADAESKLSAALRSYSLQRDELEASQKAQEDLRSAQAALNDKIALLTQEKQTLTSELAASAPALAETATIKEQLRQTQAQAAAQALELNQLKTRLALNAPAPGSLYPSPTRPGSTTAVPAATTQPP